MGFGNSFCLEVSGTLNATRAILDGHARRTFDANTPANFADLLSKGGG